VALFQIKGSLGRHAQDSLQIEALQKKQDDLVNKRQKKIAVDYNRVLADITKRSQLLRCQGNGGSSDESVKGFTGFGQKVTYAQARIHARWKT